MNRGDICSRFLDGLTHDLYPYQEEALLAWFESDAGVMVCAPTGMGKTLLAEAAVFEALHSGKRLYYTTPLIALSDQKFREMQDLAERWGFPREQVGLITGNRRENPDALVRVVVAEILLNHLLARDPSIADFEHVSAVVMDEFHSFNDFERGIVWELSLVLLPATVRVMLLSATVGNPNEFAQWLRTEHGRELRVTLSDQRRVPLEFIWVGDKLLTEHLPEMVADNDAANRTPALVFCFNRDECWEVAERLKGLSVTTAAARAEVEAYLEERKDDLVDGVGPKLKQMLVRGVGVHHAGVLPKHKEIVEELFKRKLVPFVICTETLAAGINLPARSVVLHSLLKGKHGEKKLVPSAAAHQMFGRAGRPQFDTRGYVYALAHEDDARIAKWKKKYDQIDPHSKDLGIMKMRKEMERKRPKRRTTEQYWSEGQFKSLIEAGPAKLYSRSMIPYQVLIFLLTRTGTLHETRAFVARRFNDPPHIAKFQEQLDFMLKNLAALGYLTVEQATSPDQSRAVLGTVARVATTPVLQDRREDTPALIGDYVTLHESIYALLQFRSIDPLYGAFLAEQLVRGSFEEKVLALESSLELPPGIHRHVWIPEDLMPGPLQMQVLEPLLIQMGVTAAKVDLGDDEEEEDPWATEERERPPTFPEMLKIVFEARLAAPEPVFVQPKWLGGAAFTYELDFWKIVRLKNLTKQEGLVLRHLLRLVILSGEFFTRTEDPDYQRIAELATQCCRVVDQRYTDRFLAEAEAAKKLIQA